MAKRKTGKQKANTGRTYRLCPTPAQAWQLRAWGHTRRYLYNQLVYDRLLAISLRITPSRDLSRELVDSLRACFDWVETFPSQAANEVIADIEAAFSNWADPEHPAERPTFEKRGSRLRFRLPGQAVEARHAGRKFSEVWVPKAGWVRFRRHRPIPGEVRSATFSYSPAKGWSVSFGVAAKEAVAPPNGRGGVGADFGVACSAYLSNEDAPRLMPATLTEGEKERLVGLERRKARQLTWAKLYNSGRYSNRLRRTIAEIALLRARQARRRADFTHKLTSGLAKNHGFVGIEDLRVKNMTASAKGTVEEPGKNVAQKAGLNRGILDNSPGGRRRQLGYKCPKYGSVLVPVPPQGTSQTCTECGARDPESRPGCGRAFACTSCGYQAHADKVAAVNIERRAVVILAAGPAVHSTGRRKPSHGRKAVGGPVKQVAPAPIGAGRAESGVA